MNKTKWILPSAKDGNAFMIRSIKAEEHLKTALDMLEKIKESIIENASLRIQINEFLKNYR